MWHSNGKAKKVLPTVKDLLRTADDHYLALLTWATESPLALITSALCAC